MSESDRLRAMLDECGIEWRTDRAKHTVWKIGDTTWFAKDGCRDGMVELSTILIAPEQAIAATLGSDRLTAVQVRELIAPHLHARPTFDFGRHGAVWTADFQAITDELNATVGRGECVMEYGGDVAEGTARAMDVYFCSECGSPNYNDCMPYYCIYCGKAVK